MKTKLAIGAGVVVLAVVLLVLRFRSGGPRHEHTHHDTDHAIDDTDTNVSMTAMLNAPEGATPCETAFGAIEAEQQASKLRGGPSLFKWVAPKAEFLTTCATLASDAQRCMMPRYRRDHIDECVNVRPPAQVLQRLVVAVPSSEP